MNARNILSVILVILGVILAIIPLPGRFQLRNSPSEVVAIVEDPSAEVTPDQVARMIVNEEPGFILIDVRSEDQFREANIPGSISLPYEKVIMSDLESILPPENVKKIFYSNDDIESSFAATLAAAWGLNNIAVMKGGLNRWYEDIMYSSFSGERISARENALFEVRLRARKQFIEINSLPESEKAARLAASKFDPKKLDGGCE